jgi:hypothetical protein
MVQTDLASLLGKSLTYRKQWYLNMVAAWQRCLRIWFQDPTYDDPLPDHPSLLRWMAGLILPPSTLSPNTFSSSNTFDCDALRGPQSFSFLPVFPLHVLVSLSLYQVCYPILV